MCYSKTCFFIATTAYNSLAPFLSSHFSSCHLQELLRESGRSRLTLTTRQRAQLYAVRFVINAAILGILGGFGFLLVTISEAYAENRDDLAGQIAAPLVSSGGTAALPILFYMIGAYERWENPAWAVGNGVGGFIRRDCNVVQPADTAKMLLAPLGSLADSAVVCASRCGHWSAAD